MEREAERVAREAFGLEATASPLPGELDRNFRLQLADGTRRVLKLHAAGADREALALQDAVLERLDAVPAAPRLLGSAVVSVGGEERVARLLSWLEGRPWADVEPDAARLEQLGALVARTDRALAGFEHAAMRRPLRWNLLEPPTELAAHVAPDRRALVEEVFARAPALDGLPRQVIHNDANERNVLVGDDGAVTGLIDFGDVVWSARVCGLAVAGAYAMQGLADPVRAIVPLVRGYHAVVPLGADELAALYDLMRTRLAVSVCMAAWQHARDPGNAYLLVSQDAVVELLERLAGESPDLAHFRFRDACGYDGNPAARRVRAHLATAALAPVMELGPALPWEEAIRVAPSLGRYAEDRDVYTAPEFGERTLHIGTDVFAPAGTAVRAPLAGIVRDRQDRRAPLDYGGVLVLEHATAEGEPFWTLYGHLDPASLAPGDALVAGDVVGTLGAEDANGGWPPHLHLQLATHLLGRRGGDLPGVVERPEADLWRSVFPDPNLLLGAPAGDAARVAPTDLAARRRTVMSRALSLAYREPLHIVGGAGAHLYDAQGNAYLDLVNNVAHVGHSHPRVVAAGQAQMARLNTNTRYLHDAVVEYGRRLAATLPDPLNVCFFVNSGSEANDLALRLATTHTGRTDVLVLDHAYHGHLSSLVALSPYKFDRRGGRGRPATTHVCPLPDPYRGALGADAHPYAEAVRALAAACEPAAFFAESLQSCGGQIVYPPGYLAAAFAHVRAAGGVCVADEVQVGLGRVGERFWGFELQDAVPDIVTIGKPIGNGHPLAAVVTTPEIAASFVTGMEYFNTFGGNPVSAEIGLAVLDVIADERLQLAARERGEQLLAGLRALDHPLIGDVRGHGLFLGVELSGPGRAPATREAAALKEALKARGILISTDGPDDNVLKLKPPLVIGAEDCDLFLAALHAALP